MKLTIRQLWPPIMIRSMTQHEIARELGISQARVLQLEQSAIRKLRAMPEAKELLKMCISLVTDHQIPR